MPIIWNHWQNHYPTMVRATSHHGYVRSGLLPSTPLLVGLEMLKHLRILTMIIAKTSMKKSESVIAITLLTERDPSLSQKKVYSQPGKILKNKNINTFSQFTRHLLQKKQPSTDIGYRKRVELVY